MSRLKTTYEKEIVTKLMSKLSLKNKHDVPKIDKIILNMGLGEDASDGKKIKGKLPCTLSQELDFQHTYWRYNSQLQRPVSGISREKETR